MSAEFEVPGAQPSSPQRFTRASVPRRAPSHDPDADAVVGRERAVGYRHVYVHVPFCARRCSYCDFAIAVRKVTPIVPYLEALSGELLLRLGAGCGNTPLETLYFGGGTPSRLGGDGVAQAIARVREHFSLAPDAELTVEANPEDIDIASVSTWMNAGVNRISLGVQSFDAGVLAWMHRTHDVAAVYRAAEVLAQAGLGNWSLDLIYALPAEIPRDWERDVACAIALGPAHISAYGLSVEPGTPLARWRSRGEVHDADDERFECDFLYAHDRLSTAGYVHYEVSNWARPARESRHNRSYWRNVPYLGLGPGAHGFDGNDRRWNAREFARWRERIGVREDPIEGSESLSDEQRALETAYVGLRTAEGIVVREDDAPLVDRWAAAGWGGRWNDRFVLSAKGWLRLDALVAALTDYRSRY